MADGVKTDFRSLGLLTWLADVTASGPMGAAIVWIVMAIGNGGISEEPGWRGYVVPRLQSRMSALRAGMASGLLMGLWHWGPDSWKLLFMGLSLRIRHTCKTQAGINWS